MHSPKEVAQFLMKYHDNLSKETLGDYFGEEAQFNISVSNSLVLDGDNKIFSSLLGPRSVH